MKAESECYVLLHLLLMSLLLWKNKGQILSVKTCRDWELTWIHHCFLAHFTIQNVSRMVLWKDVTVFLCACKCCVLLCISVCLCCTLSCNLSWDDALHEPVSIWCLGSTVPPNSRTNQTTLCCMSRWIVLHHHHITQMRLNHHVLFCPLPNKIHYSI